MEEENNHIGDLLKSNVRQQLADFDWNRLQAGISNQLDQTGSPKRLVSVFKIGAAVTAAAAVLLIGAIVWRSGQANVQPDNKEQTVANNDTGTKPAPLENEPSTGKWVVKLESTTAKCSVTMLDTNGGPKVETDRPKRISIIRTYTQQKADTGPDKDSTDLICLL